MCGEGGEGVGVCVLAYTCGGGVEGWRGEGVEGWRGELEWSCDGVCRCG